MRWLCRALERAAEVVAAALLAAFTIIVLADVVCRYWLSIPLGWAAELTVFLFQWTAFLGSALALRRGMHFGLGLVLPKVWPRLARPMALMIAVVVTGSSTLLVMLALKMARQTWDATYATLQIPHGMMYIGVALSASLMVLFAVEQGIDMLRGGAVEATL